MRFDLNLIFSQAFRPFFPLAAALSAVSVCLWVLGLSGFMPLSPNPTLWHAHEMLFGFASAIVLGFVLTAVENWTGEKAIAPRMLAVTVSLWGLARIAGLYPDARAQMISAFVDTPVLFIGAGCMSLALVRSRNRRNIMFIPFLFGLGLLNLLFHYSFLSGNIALARTLLHGTAWLIGFLMIFMGGRVIPFFTARKLGYRPRQFSPLNWISTLAALVVGLLVLLDADRLLPWLGLIAGLASAARWVLWSPWRSFKEPMLWILHVGYAWLIAAYALLFFIESEQLMWPATAPIHTLLAGGLGCLGLGMISRVSLGHSGRKIQSDGWITASFVLVIVAGLLRVSVYLPYADGAWSRMTLSALLWALAFLIFSVRYVPWLWMRRA